MPGFFLIEQTRQDFSASSLRRPDMTDDTPITLDKHRGMIAQKATELRRPRIGPRRAKKPVI